ncbi:MAG: Mur ligase family protein, partial [Pseudomonadota bacterium]
MAPKQLSDLGLTGQGGENPSVTGLAVDSRDVKPGFLFAALPGSNVHGAEFAQYALRQGASVVLTDAEGARLAAEVLKEYPATLAVTEDPRGALAAAAALWFGAQPETMVAVTGTNGKTSVASFTRQLWSVIGKEAINLGTTGVEGAYEAPLGQTTPEPITLHRALAEAASHGITHGAMEASSHGLEQRRLDGVLLTAAGFTNFTQDHLDYHGTFEAYFDAKARLFREVLPEDGVAVINMDDPRGADMADIAESRGQRVMTVGRYTDADFKLTAQRFDGTGQDIRVTFGGAAFTARLSLIGGFQAENVLIA